MYASRFEHLSRHISSVFITNTTAVYVIVTDLEEFSVLCLYSLWTVMQLVTLLIENTFTYTGTVVYTINCFL